MTFTWINPLWVTSCDQASIVLGWKQKCKKLFTSREGKGSTGSLKEKKYFWTNIKNIKNQIKLFFLILAPWIVSWPSKNQDFENWPEWKTQGAGGVVFLATNIILMYVSGTMCVSVLLASKWPLDEYGNKSFYGALSCRRTSCKAFKIVW